MWSMFWVFLYMVWWSSPVSSTNKILLGIGEPNSPASRNFTTKDYWLEQTLDHFNPNDNRTWKQRYHMNSEYYKNGGSVFLFIGGAEPISSQWIQSGAWIEFAKNFNALCFQLEHRYYGKSHPTEDLSTNNLVYLTSKQALADMEKFISIIVQSNTILKSPAKWVVFGGSYAGSLAVWMRMKYPHLVYAAVSSSAPLLAKEDFKEYFIEVENSLANYKPECVLQLKNSNQMIQHLLATNYGTSRLRKRFNLCSCLDRTNKKDVSNLFSSLAYSIARVVQYNQNNIHYDNPEQDLISIKSVCDVMVDKSIPIILDRYAAIIKKLLYLDDMKFGCIPTYNRMVQFHTNISWNSESANGARQWRYQTCTEFGFYQTSNQDTHVFGQNFTLDYFTDMCSDIFGKSFNSKLLSEVVVKTNMMYGGLNSREDRVIFVHGSLDPWRTLGITQSRTTNTDAIVINGASHCADMYPPSSKDYLQLKEARLRIKANLMRWL